VPPEPTEILADLEDELSDAKADIPSGFKAITRTVLKVTSANGAALGIRQDGFVVCQARSGATAPELGARLNADSGISGECLRTGRVLRCDDAYTDSRVDPEVCRALGIRSIAAIPVRDNRGTTGILEAFSTRAYAFTDEHMAYLLKLAEQAERVRSGSPVVRPASVETPVTAPALAERAKAVMAKLPRVPWYWAAVALVPIAVILGWWFGGRATPATEAATTKPVPQAAVAANPVTPEPLPSASTFKPSALRSSTESQGVVRASKIDTLATSQPQKPPAVSIERTPVPSEEAATPPALNSTAAAHLPTSMFAAPATLPNFSRPVSAGVTGGNVVSKVMPRYPVEALPLHLEGPVVIHLKVSDTGKVEDPKIVSGHPILARAALDAVRQWRYTPYQLNGQPVPMETEVTVSFKVPR
jgi:TonB family protein